VKAWRAARGISDAMYIYEDQYGWCLAPQTNSPISYVKYWDDFQRTYKTRAEAEAKRSEIWKAEGK
jgi:hypothetical protein